MVILNTSRVNRIKKLTFDDRYIYSKSGNLYIKNKKDEEMIYKILLISKITFLEKFEQVFLTIYYRHNMMLIIEFPTEGECNSYLKSLQALVDFYSIKQLEIKP